MEDGIERHMSWFFYQTNVKESSLKEEKVVKEEKVIKEENLIKEDKVIKEKF